MSGSPIESTGRAGLSGSLAGVALGLLLLLMPAPNRAAAGAQEAAGLPPACAEYPEERQVDARALDAAVGILGADSTGDAAVGRLQAGVAVRVGLQPQAGVSFAAAPGRRSLEEGAFAGILAFEVPTSGTWRIGLDHPAWVDVVAADGALVESSGFGGVRDCPAMVKVVEFPLEAGVGYRLQLSGAAAQFVGVIVSGPEAVRP